MCTAERENHMSEKSDTITVDDDSGAVPEESAILRTSDDAEKISDPLESKPSRSISIRTLALSVLTVVAVVVIGMMGWFLQNEWSQNTAMRDDARNEEQAEEVALQYATDAAAMDFKNLGAWRESLTKGTSKELAGRLTKASESMEQIITPLQWTSTSTPIAAKVEGESGGVYKVLAFVAVNTRNVQAPEGVESTATYRLTLDGNKDWLITDISGIDSALGSGSPPR